MNENKGYKWEPETQFTFNGQEFSLMYNNINKYLNGIVTPASVLRVVDAFKVLQSKLDAAIESGEAKEFTVEENVVTEQPV